jgi:hypothetical protein
MKAPKWALLGRGSAPLGLDGDNLAVTVVLPLAPGKHNGTYTIPNM